MNEQLHFEVKASVEINAAEKDADRVLEHIANLIAMEEKATEFYGPAVAGIVANLQEADRCLRDLKNALALAHAGMGDVSANFGGK